MYKTQSNNIKNLSKKEYEILRKLCWHSARLYNVALYNIRQTFFETKTFLGYYQNYHECKTNENYEILPSPAAQQTLKIADRSFKSFFGLLKAKAKGRYKERVSIPKYLKKTAHFELVIPQNGFQIKGDKINISIGNFLKREFEEKTLTLNFPTHIDATKVKEIRLIPQQNATFFKMEIVYEVKEQEVKASAKDVLSIDLGLSNLATCYDSKNNRAFICDGRKIKSINYYWNKNNAKLQSIKDKQKIKGYTKRQFLLKRKRENRIKDIMRKTAKYIVDYCIKNEIGTIIIGHNKGWKQDIAIGKRNNQNFVQVPFGLLMSLIESKCEEYGLI